MKLVIIGNGFDLYHNLPTKTSDFVKFAEAKDIDENYLVSGVDWNAYEEGLSCFDVDAMCEQFVCGPDYYSDRESDRDGVVFAMEQKTRDMQASLNDALNEMIGEAEKIIESGAVQITNDTAFCDVHILTFNYTSTIERLYALKDDSSILHIHGSYDDKDELVFGYSEPDESVLDMFENCFVSIPGRKNPFEQSGNEEPEVDYPDPYVQQQYDKLYEYYMSNQKLHRLDDLSKWLGTDISNIDEIIVLGHSMGEVDLPYFELLEQKIKPRRWIISQFDESPNIEDLKIYSFWNKVEFCDIADYVS